MLVPVDEFEQFLEYIEQTSSAVYLKSFFLKQWLAKSHLNSMFKMLKIVHIMDFFFQEKTNQNVTTIQSSTGR